MSQRWIKKRLGEVCEISSTLVDPRKPEFINLLHIGAGNMISETGELVDIKTAKEEGLKSGKFLFDRTMVLYSKIRPYLMKVARPDFDGLCSADVYPLSPDTTQLDRNFLFYLLISREFTEYAIEGSSRAGMPKVNRDHLFNFTTYIPPLPEQKRIMAIMDEAFEGIDRAIANTEKNLANSRELFESYLNAVFIKKGDGWVENKMGDLLVTLTDYHANGSYEILKQNVRLLDNDGYAYMVRSTDFENNFTNPLKYIDKHAYEFLRKSKVFGGEIIISKIGNAGKVYLMPSIDRPCSLAMNLFLLRTDVNKIRSDYLYFFLESRFGKVQIAERLNGTTTKTIRKDGIRSLNILVPPLPEQKNIVDKLDSIVFETQRLETISRQKLAALNELKQSILQKAFTGELTADKAKNASEEIAA